MPLQYNTTIAPHTQLPPIQEVHLGRFLKCISNKILQDNYVFSLVGTSVGKQMPHDLSSTFTTGASVNHRHMTQLKLGQAICLTQVAWPTRASKHSPALPRWFWIHQPGKSRWNVCSDMSMLEFSVAPKWCERGQLQKSPINGGSEFAGEQRNEACLKVQTRASRNAAALFFRSEEWQSHKVGEIHNFRHRKTEEVIIEHGQLWSFPKWKTRPRNWDDSLHPMFHISAWSTCCFAIYIDGKSSF